MHFKYQQQKKRKRRDNGIILLTGALLLVSMLTKVDTVEFSMEQEQYDLKSLSSFSSLRYLVFSFPITSLRPWISLSAT